MLCCSRADASFLFFLLYRPLFQGHTEVQQLQKIFESVQFWIQDKIDFFFHSDSCLCAIPCIFKGWLGYLLKRTGLKKALSTIIQPGVDKMAAHSCCRVWPQRRTACSVWVLSSTHIIYYIWSTMTITASVCARRWPEMHWREIHGSRCSWQINVCMNKIWSYWWFLHSLLHAAMSGLQSIPAHLCC